MSNDEANSPVSQFCERPEIKLHVHCHAFQSLTAVQGFRALIKWNWCWLTRRPSLYRDADKSLARPGRKQDTSMSKSSRMLDPTRSREMPSCSATDLAEIRRSSKISSWIWLIISRVVGLRTYQQPGRNDDKNFKKISKLKTVRWHHVQT